MSLRLDEDGYIWTSEAGEATFITRGDAQAVKAIRGEIGRQKRVALKVAESATLKIRLIRMPKTRAETRSMLRDLSPVPLGEVAWTRPRPLDEGATLTLVKRAWLDPRVAEIETALGIEPRVIVEPDGDLLVYRSPAHRRRNMVTRAVVAASIAIAAVALNMSRDTEGVAVAEVADAGFGTLPDHGAVARTVSTIAETGLAEQSLVAISSDATGNASVEMLINDPDTLQADLLSTGALRSFQETARTSEQNGGYRVAYSSRFPTPKSLRSAPVLTATNRAKAASRLRAMLEAEASSRVIELRLDGDGNAGTAPISMKIDAVGPQGAVLGLADRIESGLPPVRLTQWRLQADSAGARLTGTLVAPWRQSQ